MSHKTVETVRSLAPRRGKCFIVAEIGMNHMGDPHYADDYVRTLIEARPDGVTFQVRESAYYDKHAKGESTQLDDRYYRGACKALHDAGIRFGVALCDPQRAAFFEDIGADFYKILSKDIGDGNLIDAVAASGKPVHVSTGMSDEEEIASFLQNSAEIVSQVSLIHTQLSYDDGDTNLRAIGRLHDRFGIPVGFGSHSTDVNALYAATGFDPAAIFFYVKGARPIQHKDEDHAVALAATKDVIREIRRLETMLGDGVKQKMPNRIAAQAS